MEQDVVAALEPTTVFSLAGLVYLALAVAAGCHVLLHKQNESAAFSWLGIIVLSPLLGAVMYWLFGVNRIRRRAQAYRPPGTRPPPLGADGAPLVAQATPAALEPRFRQLMHLGAAIHPTPYTGGNAIVALTDGDEGYPRMLRAIEGATGHVLLSSYIFAHDAVGRRFVEALVRAHERGVTVRVLIDGVGVSYGFARTRADRVLRRHGVRSVRFLSALSTTGTRFLNLRNHRKILAVDGRVAFVGGLNIRENNLVAVPGRHRTRDLHFEVRGPLVDQIQDVFVDDWRFASKERGFEVPTGAVGPDEACGSGRESGGGSASGPADGPVREPGGRPGSAADAASGGGVRARVLLDGPDENYAKLQMTMVGAINAARTSVRVVTPYFLPDRTVVNALQLAALRGVAVDIVVPERNNLPFVGWAMQANEWRLAGYGIHLHHSPDPFDHTKLFLVDGTWTLIGSSNWDSRSLELNFEINVECYDGRFAAAMTAVFEAKRASARALGLPPRRALPVRLRNNFFRLFSPYL